MSQFTNIRTVSVPSIGKIALADKPGSFTPSGVSRAHRAGRLATDGGFTESATPAKLDLNLNLVAGMDVDALKEIVDEDVTVRLSDGSVYLMAQAFCENPSSVQDDGGSKLVLIANVSERIA